MKITIWNSFASNNSGSYTIVGRFETAEEAAAIAERLDAVCLEHDEWVQDDARRKSEASPLGAFIRGAGLSVPEDEGTTDDWPQYSGTPPRALAIGHQVVLHSDYTVTMPRCFGELFYRESGRVDVELDHAHHPIIARFEVWLEGFFGPMKLEWRTKRRSARKDFESVEATSIVVRDGEWGSLQVLAVFEDLVEGVRAVRDVVSRRGLSCSLTLVEAPDEKGDVLAGYR